MRKALWAAASAGICLIGSSGLQAAVVYSTAGSTYSQNFDSLPTTPENASIETVYTDGWQDDVDPAASSQSDISIPGWYLWHSVSPASENGFNGNQRFRITAGSSTTGAFNSYGASGSTERALGSLGSTTIANQPTGTPPANDTRVLTALRLTNGTGGTLTEFTLTYTGEQWRNGGETTPTSETLLFDYSLDATAPQTGTFVAEPSLNFTTPVFTVTASSVDGNAAANRQTLTATITGINWLPGTDLWLRWNDPQRLGNDHGVAIDDLSFSAAVPEPTCVGVLAVGMIGMLSRRRRTI